MRMVLGERRGVARVAADAAAAERTVVGGGAGGMSCGTCGVEKARAGRDGTRDGAVDWT